MKIVTAANDAYFSELWQFLASARRSGAAARHEIIVYDLGLRAEQRRRLHRRYGIEVRLFDFSAYPPHVRRLAYCAWKPLIIRGELGDGPLLWLDSATLLREDLVDIERFIRNHGLYTLTGQSGLRTWCHPTSFAAMGVPTELQDKPIRVGCVLGFDGAAPAVHDLVARWASACLDEHILAPEGSSRDNHRYDQSLFNNVLYLMISRGELSLTEAGDADISATDPVHQLTTRNKVPPWWPVWGLGAVRLWYAVYKRIDRLLLRIEHDR